MIINWSDVTIYLKPGPTDMRKQINGLSVLIEEECKIRLLPNSKSTPYRTLNPEVTEHLIQFLSNTFS
jgi:hypothetical protein